MTKFEKSCIEAICESPMAFELFRKRAHNVKRVDQFVNKIWPYRLRSNKKTKSKDNLQAVRRVRDILYAESLIPNANSDSEVYEFNFTITQFKKEMNIIGKLTSIERLCPAANNILQMCEDNSDLIMQLSGGKHSSVATILNEIYVSNVFDSKKILINRHSGRDYSKQLLKQAVAMFDKALDKRVESKSTYLNVGIEIEYSGINMSYFSKELIKNRAVSFDSGWDGDSTGRLRENRLRIAGVGGLKPLKLLLIEMEKKSCVLDQASGIHYHIDCSETDPMRLIYKGKRIEILKLLKDKYPEVRGIFGVNESDVLHYLQGRIRVPDEFETLEWRMIYPSLNYSLMVSQMLFCIYMTKIATSYNEKNPPKINGEYLSLLANISKKIIAKIEQR